jgi:hypothetical protein
VLNQAQMGLFFACSKGMAPLTGTSQLSFDTQGLL